MRSLISAPLRHFALRYSRLKALIWRAAWLGSEGIFRDRRGQRFDIEHLPPGSRRLDARMRSHAGRILVVDDRVPYPALGSGFPRANEMLRTIHAAGWFVTLFPLTFPNVVWEEAHRVLPRDIEIIADHGIDGLEAFLRERVGYYDAALVSRPHNMEFFRKAARKVPDFLVGTKLIYDAEAIFASRDAIRFALEGRPLSKARQNWNVRREVALGKGATALVAVGEHEAQLFRAASKAPVHVVGHSVVPNPTAMPFEARSDILFVGAVDDDRSPNADSLIWFVRAVMPKLDRFLGTDYKFKIVGRNRSSEVEALAGPRVELLGRVEHLGIHYERARLFVAPTRYAAGLPRKVHEAAAAGLPVVATNLLAGQLGWQDGIQLLVADRPEDFAAACNQLYTDPALWYKLRNAALDRIKTDCSPVEFERRVATILAAVAPQDALIRIRAKHGLATNTT